MPMKIETPGPSEETCGDIAQLKKNGKALIQNPGDNEAAQLFLDEVRVLQKDPQRMHRAEKLAEQTNPFMFGDSVKLVSNGNKLQSIEVYQINPFGKAEAFQFNSDTMVGSKKLWQGRDIAMRAANMTTTAEVNFALLKPQK